MLNFQTWLESPARTRAVLVEAEVSAYNTTTLVWENKAVYLGTHGYLTNDSLTSFLPIIIGGGQFSENLSLDGSISMSFGDIELDNANGEYDSWLDSSKFIWVNKPIQVYFGDASQNSVDLANIKTNTFEKVFDGIIADLDSSSRTSLNLKVRDKLEQLNTPLTENKLGNTYFAGTGLTQSTQDSIRPIVFGEVHNITPVLLDPSTLEYIFNDGVSERLIEVRDNGVPVTLGTTNLSLGTFRLLFPSTGALTASVQGTTNSVNLSSNGVNITGYSDTVAKLIATICMRYGSANSKLVPNDVDFVNMQAFNSLHPQPVGVAISDRENVLTICALLASSVGAQLYFNRLGKLQLLK